MPYESYIHPLTILSTLPSAGVGALLMLMLMMFGFDFSVIALIGVILLIGIVKKNGIMMVDFAIAAQRDRGVRRDPRGMSVAVPTDHDDDDGSAARRGAADARIGYRRGIAPAPRLFHGRRPYSQPGADAVHDARDLLVSGADQLLVIKSITQANTGSGRHGGAATRAASGQLSLGSIIWSAPALPTASLAQHLNVGPGGVSVAARMRGKMIVGRSSVLAGSPG
jgi:hypothetical protein